MIITLFKKKFTQTFIKKTRNNILKMFVLPMFFKKLQESSIQQQISLKTFSTNVGKFKFKFFFNVRKVFKTSKDFSFKLRNAIEKIFFGKMVTQNPRNLCYIVSKVGTQHLNHVP